MKYAVIIFALAFAVAINASASSTRTRMLVSATNSGPQASSPIAAQLADGATLELKTVIGGAILTIQKEERGEVVESSIQSVTNNEAANLRELIANAAECPVELTFVQDQLVQAKSVCK
jgi:hypothetical protein